MGTRVYRGPLLQDLLSKEFVVCERCLVTVLSPVNKETKWPAPRAVLFKKRTILMWTVYS